MRFSDKFEQRFSEMLTHYPTQRSVLVPTLLYAQDEVGFLSDIRRTNVAMTRARKKLIMVGDSATLGSHPFYVELLEHVQEHGFYKSAFELK